MAAKKGGLGKGLDAIFMENATEDSNHIITLKISEIEPNRTPVSYTHLDVYKRQPLYNKGG